MWAGCVFTSVYLTCLPQLYFYFCRETHEKDLSLYLNIHVKLCLPRRVAHEVDCGTKIYMWGHPYVLFLRQCLLIFLARGCLK